MFSCMASLSLKSFVGGVTITSGTFECERRLLFSWEEEVEVIREMECLELAFDRERSFLKNISRYDNRRVRGDDFCREG